VFAIGVAAALVASALFNVGIVLQALDARAAPRSLGLHLSLLRRLLARPRWVVGFVLGVIGIGPQVLAYADAPFVVVQPALALGLVIVLLLGHRMMDEGVTPRDVIGVSAIIAGVALLAWGAPAHNEVDRGWPSLVALVGAVSLLGLSPFLVRARWAERGMPIIIAAGCGFGATNIATKLLGDDVNAGHYANAAIWAAVGLAMGVVATLTTMTAFQRCRATTVVPVSTAVQTFLPIVLEPLFLVERWSSAVAYGAPIIFGLALALLGTVLVSGTSAVSELVAGAQG